MTTLADQIRAHIDNGAQLFESDRALLAVLDECERLRVPSGMTTEGRWKVADRIESVIARGLGINPEETS